MGDILQACAAVAVWVLGAAVCYWVMKRWFPAKDGNEDNMIIFCVVSWPVSLLIMVGILVWDRIKKPGGGDDDTMATDVDDEGLLTYRNEAAFNPMTLCVEPGRIYVRESPF